MEYSRRGAGNLMGASRELPSALVAAAAREDDGRRLPWLQALPGVLTGLARRWDLELGSPFQPGGESSWVAPARDGAGRDLVLKAGWRHVEAEHEADGLRMWDGRGAVRLLASHVEGQTAALLLERCRPGDVLADRSTEEQDDVICTLLQRLWVEPARGHPFRPLAQLCHWWADLHEETTVALDPGVRRAGLDLFRWLPLDDVPQALLVTDLHAGNVLRAQREPWLVIDPKPWVGDPTYDLLQHMLNHPERLQRNAAAFADDLAGRCGLDPQRLQAWLFARCVIETRQGLGWIAEVARSLAP